MYASFSLSPFDCARSPVKLPLFQISCAVVPSRFLEVQACPGPCMHARIHTDVLMPLTGCRLTWANLVSLLFHCSSQKNKASEADVNTSHLQGEMLLLGREFQTVRQDALLSSPFVVVKRLRVGEAEGTVG